MGEARNASALPKDSYRLGRLVGAIRFASLLIYHNVVAMTKALERLAADGHTFDEELVSRISPYLTENINRLAGIA